MYVTNDVDKLSISKEKIFKCNATIANYLVYECKLPLLGKDSEGKYCFMVTEELNKAIRKMPTWYNFGFVKIG